MYAVNPRPEYVINNKKPVYELTTISPCPKEEKHRVQVRITTGKHSSGGGTVDPALMALKLECRGWTEEFGEIELDEPTEGQTIKWKGKVPEKVVAVGLYKTEDTDPWKVQKVSVSMDKGKPVQLIDGKDAVWIGKDAHMA